MPPTRLLVVADAKVLPALASGLRDGGAFDVVPVPLADLAAAQAAADKADAVALFYGAPDKTVASVLPALAPKARARGARVVAVLQREQAAQRDECFRAGASDLLFMPMPREQFVQRMKSAVSTSFDAARGPAADVSVAARGTTLAVEGATICPGGVVAPRELALKAGDTVRISFGNVQSWGLVVRPGPQAWIRFAGLSVEEQGRIDAWIAEQRAFGGPAADPQPPARPAASRVPAAGPPPGFAERQGTRAPVRPGRTLDTPPPAGPRAGPAAPAAAPKIAPAAGAPKIAPPKVAPVAKATPAKQDLGTALFDESFATPATVTPAPEAPPPGPPWPPSFDVAACRTAFYAYFADRTLPPDLPPAVAGSIKKIVATERTAFDAGPASAFADAVAARLVLDAATSEGARLAAAGVGATLEQDAFTALTKIADEAASGLQKEANAAVGKGQVETLQLITAASAALSRDLLAFKQTGDRLRGLAAAPRLGAGSLDPEIILPGQQPRPRAPQKDSAPAPVRPELREFEGLEANRPSSWKPMMLVFGLMGLAAAVTHAMFFAMPRVAQVAVENGPNVASIVVSGKSALVTVKPGFARGDVPRLVETLRALTVDDAILVWSDGKPAGNIDVKTGTPHGVKAK